MPLHSQRQIEQQITSNNNGEIKIKGKTAPPTTNKTEPTHWMNEWMKGRKHNNKKTHAIKVKRVNFYVFRSLLLCVYVDVVCASVCVHVPLCIGVLWCNFSVCCVHARHGMHQYNHNTQTNHSNQLENILHGKVYNKTMMSTYCNVPQYSQATLDYEQERVCVCVCVHV